MKKLILLLVLFPITLAQAYADIHALQVEFRENGVPTTVYFIVGYWGQEDLSNYIGNREEFRAAFFENHRTTDSIQCYTRIIDHQYIANAAKFPMHSFEIDDSSLRTVHPNQLNTMKLVHAWYANEYWINVLTPIMHSDADWIGGKAKTTYPVGNEVGCRLEVYHFTKTDSEKWEKEMAALYLLETRTKEQEKRFQMLFELLKRHRVVVVEMCGC